MIKNCIGCGVTLQCTHSESDGFVRKDKIDSSEYCERCFKIIHYGKNNGISNDINTKDLIKDINNSKYAVIYAIDILSITEDTIKFLKNIKNRKYILLTKFDLLPRGIKEGKIIKYFKNNFYGDAEVFCVSSKNKYNVEKIYNLLLKDKIENIYVAGLTNAGKSTFINSLLSLNNMKASITTSSIPNTTHNYLNIKIGKINFIDTPGFDTNNSIYNYLSNEMLLKIKPKKELKVKTFQLKSEYSIIVEDFLRIDYIEGHMNSLNFYMNSNLEYKKLKSKSAKALKTLPNKTFKIEGKKDIVIEGLGFIKINKPGIFIVYSLDENVISVRNNMV